MDFQVIIGPFSYSRGAKPNMKQIIMFLKNVDEVE